MAGKILTAAQETKSSKSSLLIVITTLTSSFKKLLSLSSGATFRLFLPWNQKSVTSCFTCFIYINHARPCWFHLCIYMCLQTQTGRSSNQRGPRWNRRPFRGPPRQVESPGRGFTRSYSVATQGGPVADLMVFTGVCLFVCLWAGWRQKYWTDFDTVLTTDGPSAIEDSGDPDRISILDQLFPF